MVPDGGDDTRKWGPPFLERNGHKEAAYFLCVNRNKKSVVLDFKQPKDLEAVKKLAMKSDVLVENFLPGKLKKFGLDFESLKHGNPGLIHCSITGFGQDGPYSHRGGYDVIAASIGGLMHITGPKVGQILKSVTLMTF